MTGFGKSTFEVPGKNINIEIRSLNSKQSDISIKLPGFYKEKEIDIRNLLLKELIRGKIEFTLYSEIESSEKIPKINQKVFQNYYKQLETISNELGIKMESSIVQSILKLPDTLKIEREQLDEAEWKLILEGISNAITHINAFREQEGKAMEKDFIRQIERIKMLLNKLSSFEKERIELVKTRLKNGFKEFQKDNQIDENRFEQELIFYLEKLDINEEKVRLENHCTYFIETIQNEFPNGKKLGFIVQEIGREINTIGSKANHSEMQKIVVQMKDELEKIKEQALNVL